MVRNEQELAFDQSPIIKDDRVMVPIRTIFEAFGYTLEWKQSTNTAVAQKENKKITVTVDNLNIFHNNGTYTCDVAPINIHGRILVPVRAISEIIGCIVEWDGNSRTVIITSE